MEGNAPELKRSKSDPTSESSSPSDAPVESPSKDVKRKIAKRSNSKELKTEPASSSTTTQSQKEATEADKKDAKVETPSTNMMDMNDHCLFEMMSRMGLRELCSMAEVSVPLKGFAQQVFTLNHSHVSLTSLADPQDGKYTLSKVRQLLYNFGPYIKSLTIDESSLNDREVYGKLLQLVRKYCLDTLDKIVFLDQPSDHISSMIATMIFGQDMYCRDVDIGERRHRSRTQITYQPRKITQEQFLLVDQ